MKALSIRQPWADLILYHGKDVENRTWSTAYRGPLVIHAGKARDREGFSVEAIEFLRDMGLSVQDIVLLDVAPRGGIVGMVDLVGVTNDSSSPWAVPGQWHWLLRNPRWMSFRPLKGRLGLFEVEGSSRTVGQVN